MMCSSQNPEQGVEIAKLSSLADLIIIRIRRYRAWSNAVGSLVYRNKLPRHR